GNDGDAAVLVLVVAGLKLYSLPRTEVILSQEDRRRRSDRDDVLDLLHPAVSRIDLVLVHPDPDIARLQGIADRTDGFRVLPVVAEEDVEGRGRGQGGSSRWGMPRQSIKRCAATRGTELGASGHNALPRTKALG